jgi:hypothetical protein
MKMTEDLIHQGMSGAGGWNRAQMKALGVGWPLKSGWKQRLIGQEIDDAKVKEFLSLKGNAGKAKRRVPLTGLVLDGLLHAYTRMEADDLTDLSGYDERAFNAAGEWLKDVWPRYKHEPPPALGEDDIPY